MSLQKSEVIEDKITSAVISGENKELSNICQGCKSERGVDTSLFYIPMKAAIMLNNVEAARILLQEGFDVHSWDHISGSRPLVLAAYKGRTEIVKMLVEAGVDINLRDRNGFSAIFHAVFNGDVAMTEYLIRHGATVGDKYEFRVDEHFTKKMFITAYTKNQEILKLLENQMNQEFMHQEKAEKVARHLGVEEENPGHYPIVFGNVALVEEYNKEHRSPTIFEYVK